MAKFVSLVICVNTCRGLTHYPPTPARLKQVSHFLCKHLSVYPKTDVFKINHTLIKLYLKVL